MSTDILSRIVETKTAEVTESKKKISESDLRKQAEQRKEFRPFFQRLAKPGASGVNIIAEIKRASPSKGLICPDLNPAMYAQKYEKGGAAALSVLTDTQYFQGSFADFKAARQACQLPMLRKDFLISPYQIYESVVLGADAILLIVRILEPEQLKEYLQLSGELKLDVLTEVHSESELEIADKAGAKLVGVNNRNLKSFETDISRAAAMVSRFSSDLVPVAESGIHTREDIIMLQKDGIFNFLIGESLVRSSDPQAFLKTLMGR
ncbi:MAG: indole-3-glycerol phosphate synthase TrpC [Desulfococcaceae bacterium]